ncbi:hypothetical protein KBI33_00530 [Candidatus Shapirobacteria bacterium]|nr:hypothetical protein [Candidatus Shapirobacteria bacterium]
MNIDNIERLFCNRKIARAKNNGGAAAAPDAPELRAERSEPTTLKFGSKFFVNLKPQQITPLTFHVMKHLAGFRESHFIFPLEDSLEGQTG